MRISHEWLTALLGPLPAPDDVARILTQQGLEVEALELRGAGLLGAVVAEVAKLEKVTERLTRVTLRTAGGEAVCVTGARNLSPGNRVPYAPPGAQLPDGRTLEVAELHGVPSHGMLLSADEIGIGPDHDGILILPQNAPVGDDVAHLLGLPDAVYELGLTPSFAQHCQSARGIAQELAAPLGLRLPAAASESLAPREEAPRVTVDDPELSPLYAGIWLVRTAQVETPLWMRRRLWSCGMRSVSPIVDLTNYVMLEVGQPMHPFAQEKIQGGIHVRCAAAGERLLTLDGEERALDPSDIVIADARGAVAIAGVMGSARAEVDEATDRVFLESALFSARRVGRTMRRLGLRSEAAQRFAHGLAADLPLRAVARVRELAPEVGWQALPGGLTVGGVAPEAAPIRVEAAYVRTLLGLDLTAERQAAALESLGFSVDVTEDGLRVRAPRDRIDVRGACDVAEEVLRAVGIDRVAAVLPPPAPAVAEPEIYGLRRSALGAFMALGYRVAVGYSLVDPELLARIGQPAEVTIANALSGDLAALRTTLRLGLLQAVARNLARGVGEIALCEAGRVFHRQGGEVLEEESLGFTLCGPRAPLSRFGQQPVDFFDLKGDLEAALSALRVSDVEMRAGSDAALHTGRQAEVFAAGRRLGSIGEVHPDIAEQLGISERVLIGEISLQAVLASERPLVARPLPRYPALVRDVALVVDEQLPYDEVRREVADVLGGLLAADALFDVFVGAPVPPGKKSLALRLWLRSPERTLAEADAEEALANLLRRLGDRFGAHLR